MSESVGSTPAGLGFGLGRSNETRRAGKIQGGCEAVLTFEAKGSQSCYGSSSGDEGLRLQFLSSQTLWHVAEAVCEHVLGGSRGDDNGIYEHLWEFRAGHETARGGKVKWLPGRYEGPFDDAFVCESSVLQTSPQHSTRLSSASLGIRAGSVLNFEYDKGSTSRVHLRCVQVMPLEKEAADSSSFPRVVLPPPGPKVVPAEEARLLIETCPAFAVAPELRLDTLFPSFARGFLNPDHCSVTLGLSSMTCHWDDATFATLEGEPSDVLLAPTPFDNLDEFLAVADAAIAKGYSSDIQRGWHTHFIFPSELPEDAAERLERVRARYHTDPIAAYGTQKSFHRFTELEKAEATSALAAKGFSFAAMFPKTTQQFTSGRFRWIKYSRGVLKVAVGRGTGKLSRSCEERNLLREWRLPFGSLHELMCAAEQSWVLPSSDPPQPLGEMLLPQDSDLGPSDPQPDVLASPANFRSLPTGSLPGSPKVTALAFGDGAARSESLHLYSGHSDGTVAKWDLKSDKLLWKIQAHEPRAILEDEEDDEYSDMEGPLSNAMVCGLLVHPSGREVYSWAREAVVKNWDAMSGAALRQFDCTPALEEHGFRWQDDPVGAPSPNVNCAVLARLGTCGDALLVGLHALGAAPDEGGCVADGDKPPGNVMPFELATAMQMPTWRGHTFPVSAIAVVNDKGLAVSVGQCHMLDDMILWDLQEPGRMLRRLEFRPDGYNQRWMHRLHEVCGIAVDKQGNVVLLANSGTTLAVVDAANLRITGYLNIGLAHCEEDFDACMATDGQRIVAANAASEVGLVFEIANAAKSAPSDKRSVQKLGGLLGGSCSDDEHSEDDYYDDDDGASDEGSRLTKGRRQAMGTVSFPSTSAGQQKMPCIWNGGVLNDDDDDDDDDGGGGDVCAAVLALDGTLMASGYNNGAIRIHNLRANGLVSDPSLQGASNCAPMGRYCWWDNENAPVAVWCDPETGDVEFATESGSSSD